MSTGPFFLEEACDLLGRKPAFLTLVFAETPGGNVRVHQRVNAADVVVSLRPITHHTRPISLRRYGHTRSVGDSELLCFAFAEDDLYVGDTTVFGLGLRDLCNDPRLHSLPVTRLLLAERCRNAATISEATAQAFEQLARVSEASAKAFRDDFTLTRVCRSTIARAVRLLDRPVEEYDVLRKVRVRAEDNEVVAQVKSPELSALRQGANIETLLSSALEPYLTGFSLRGQLRFEYILSRDEEAGDQLQNPDEQVSLFAIGRDSVRTLTAIARRRTDKNLRSLQKRHADVQEFVADLPYDITPKAGEHKIIFADAPKQALEVLPDLVSQFPRGTHTLVVYVVSSLQDESQWSALELSRELTETTVVLIDRPTWRNGGFSTTTKQKLSREFFKAYTSSLGRKLESGRRPQHMLFSLSYMSGGIRSLESSVSQAVASAANGVFPLYRCTRADILVTSVARVSNAYAWQARRVLSSHVTVPEEQIGVQSWRLAADPYGNSATVGLLAQVPEEPGALFGKAAVHELELVLRASGERYQREEIAGQAAFRIFGNHEEEVLLLTAGEQLEEMLFVSTILIANDIMLVPPLGSPSRAIPVIPMSTVNLVTGSKDSFRVAKFIDYHWRRGIPDWLFEQTQEALRQELRQIPAEELGFRDTGAPEDLIVSPRGTSFRRPSLRRNYEIAVAGHMTVVAEGIPLGKRKKVIKELTVQFSLLHRPLADPRWLRLEIG